MTPVPASQSRGSRRRRGSGPSGGKGGLPFVFPLVGSLVLLAGGSAVLVDIAPRARDYRLLAEGLDVHGTATSCVLAPNLRDAPRARLRLAYMTPSGRFEIDESTSFATCADALAEPRDHRVIYAPSRPTLAVPLADAHILRMRLIATMAGALVTAAGGLWGLWSLAQRFRTRS